MGEGLLRLTCVIGEKDACKENRSGITQGQQPLFAGPLPLRKIWMASELKKKKKS